jgi:hypothetical protein
VANFTVGENITRVFTYSGRILSLQNVYLNPFSWQIYSSSTNGYLVIVEESVLQLVDLEAGGTNVALTIINSQIWSQSIQAGIRWEINNCK